ncbi:hypothetical protein [Paraburkholderia sp. HD33-4]|uniref:hypothetical protein n=1 Tax=Paraburkholderia sp. HD33-4 TaxID=2883242 RepID=UPI001F3EFFC1|nr:hypothetical protein [Paraburkholderia sp. HD33-4]
MSRQKIADELNGLCRALFDGWRERRCMIPLAYLLHVWPLVDATQWSFKRLRDNLRDLECWHLNYVSDEDGGRIRYLLGVLSQQAGSVVSTSTN